MTNYTEFDGVEIRLNQLQLYIHTSSKDLIDRVRGLGNQGYIVDEIIVNRRKIKRHSMSDDMIPGPWHGLFKITTPNNRKYEISVDASTTAELRVNHYGEDWTTRPVDDLLSLLSAITSEATTTLKNPVQP